MDEVATPRNWASSDSSERLLVSGTALNTKKIDTRLISTKIPKVPVDPSAAFTIGKRNEISASTTHSTKTATPIAKPRMASGKISDSSSHTPVPMKHCTNATKI